MSFTYDPSLGTSSDLVRFLIGDVDATKPLLSNEEISAVLALQTATVEAARPYRAAIEALRSIQARWVAGAKGISEKTVGGTRWKFASAEESFGEALDRRVRELEAMALKISGRQRVLTARGNVVRAQRRGTYGYGDV